MNNDGNNTECECVLNLKFDLSSIGFGPHIYYSSFPFKCITVSAMQKLGPYVKIL